MLRLVESYWVWGSDPVLCLLVTEHELLKDLVDERRLIQYGPSTVSNANLSNPQKLLSAVRLVKIQ